MVEMGEIKRLMIFLPPRHGKSELASKLFPAWYIGRNPSSKIMVASYSSTLASHFGYEVRNLVKEEKYRQVFQTALKEDSQARDMWRTTEGGIYLSDGVGGSFTGHGADILLIDDPVKNREEANSETVQNKNFNWYTSTARTRLSEHGAIVIINTRWSDRDLVGMILAENPEKWTVLSYPAIATGDEKYRKEGEALWPQKFSLENLLETKQELKADWSALYQQNPIDEESAQFKRSMFRYYDKDSLPDLNNMWIVTGVDPAISKKETADYSAVVTLGVTRSMTDRNILGRIYVLDYVNRRMNPSELIDVIFDQKMKWGTDVFAIETVAYQAALVHFLKDAMKRKQVMLRIEEVKSTIQKEKRINGLIPYYQNNIVEHATWMNDLEEQLLRFPVGAHEDIIDAFSHCLPFLIPPAVMKDHVNRGRSVKQIMKQERNLQYQSLDSLSL